MPTEDEQSALTSEPSRALERTEDDVFHLALDILASQDPSLWLYFDLASSAAKGVMSEPGDVERAVEVATKDLEERVMGPGTEVIEDLTRDLFGWLH